MKQTKFFENLKSQIQVLFQTNHNSPLNTKELAKQLNISTEEFSDFRKVVRKLIRMDVLKQDQDQALTMNTMVSHDDQSEDLKTTSPQANHGKQTNLLQGIFRRHHSGDGWFQPAFGTNPEVNEIFIANRFSSDACTGDEVKVRILHRARGNRSAEGEVVQIVQRATKTFVGTMVVKKGRFFVQIDGTMFSELIEINDLPVFPLKEKDKVVLEMVRFPKQGQLGEGVITEVLGQQGDPEVDISSVIRSLGIPDHFSEEVLIQARQIALNYDEKDYKNRTDFTKEVVITIDPIDARDFDDAIALSYDSGKKRYQLVVHVADVSSFIPQGSLLDLEAFRRATSVYLPQKVIPMLPELISNGVASLQEGKNRLVKSVIMSFNEKAELIDSSFTEGIICVCKRFTYEQVTKILQNKKELSMLEKQSKHGEIAGNDLHQSNKTSKKQSRKIKSQHESIPLNQIRVENNELSIDPVIMQMLYLLEEFTRKRLKLRGKRGTLELSLPEPILEFDAKGYVSGAHFAQTQDISHQIIEECMVTANESVAKYLTSLNLPFIRRVHPAPKEEKLQTFAEFIHGLGYTISDYQNRHQLVQVLQESKDKPERFSIHYALLRSLKQANYSPQPQEHYALALEDYCHFTSPIRRYPDLSVHRLLGKVLKMEVTQVSEIEMVSLAEHCGKMARRAEEAEREVIKLRILHYLSGKPKWELDAIITGVNKSGFFAMGIRFPAEGFVHVRTLLNDYYDFDESTQSLIGRRKRTHIFQLGKRVRVRVLRVDPERRELDFEVIASAEIQKEKHKKNKKLKDRKLRKDLKKLKSRSKKKKSK